MASTQERDEPPKMQEREGSRLGDGTHQVCGSEGPSRVCDRAWLGTLRRGKAPPLRKAEPRVAAAASKVLLFLAPKDGSS